MKKKFHNYYKEIKKECERCKIELDVWVAQFNQGREEGVKNALYQHCPVCRVIEKNKKK